MKPTIAIFLHHPECSEDCVNGMTAALGAHYTIKTFDVAECRTETFAGIDIVAFPGGIGDAGSYVASGGRYLGICMGAYWASGHYFDLLDGVDAVQYIKQPTSDIKRSYGTVAPVLWDNKPENIFFYDGCALVGDSSKFETVATYANGDALAIIQNRVGIIGCHPESLEYWYEAPYQYINSYWHHGAHHKLLLGFVDQLMNK